ncbi:hypothetical protein ACI65C_004126 [Semiaphis heraclei]
MMYTNIKTVQEKLNETIKVVKTKYREEYVQLTTLQLIVQDTYRLLMILDGRWLLLMSLEAVSCTCFALLLSWLIKKTDDQFFFLIIVRSWKL